MSQPLRVRRLGALVGAPHAIPYQGSKRRLAHVIAPLLPGDTARLLEPFAGSAAIAIAARHLGIGRVAEISDINEPLMGLWRRILDDPAALGADYSRLWSEQLADPRDYYERVRTAFNRSHQPHHLLYLLARCVKAAVRYNREGEFNQGADHRRLGARPKAMLGRLAGTARVLVGTRAHVADYTDVLGSADRADVAYLDPPYQGVTGSRDHRYVAGLPRAAVVEQLQAAIDRETSFILSYDGSSGERRYGDPLPADLGLLHLTVHAGPSSQATLNGTGAHTIESIYLSPALVGRIGGADAVTRTLAGSAIGAQTLTKKK